MFGLGACVGGLGFGVDLLEQASATTKTKIYLMNDRKKNIYVVFSIEKYRKFYLFNSNHRNVYKHFHKFNQKP